SYLARQGARLVLAALACRPAALWLARRAEWPVVALHARRHAAASLGGTDDAKKLTHPSWRLTD
ncbi:unnamed protein product, partial [Amoebophrya sp. A120]